MTRQLTDADLVGALMALRSMIAEHCRRVRVGEPVLWSGLGDMLDLCAQHCYECADQELATRVTCCDLATEG